ncbi:hypothetical protein BDZ45DRAFT_805729 [Acephala macrosclerotiorum]|nr:hypothetical protein BDZ45DRAFT_805729 [Acephala macrosclerotiorum]
MQRRGGVGGVLTRTAFYGFYGFPPTNRHQLSGTSLIPASAPPMIRPLVFSHTQPGSLLNKPPPPLEPSWVDADKESLCAYQSFLCLRHAWSPTDWIVSSRKKFNDVQGSTSCGRSLYDLRLTSNTIAISVEHTAREDPHAELMRDDTIRFFSACQATAEAPLLSPLLTSKSQIDPQVPFGKMSEGHGDAEPNLTPFAPSSTKGFISIRPTSTAFPNPEKGFRCWPVLSPLSRPRYLLTESPSTDSFHPA